MADPKDEFSKLFQTVGSSGEIQFRIPQTVQEESDDNMSLVSEPGTAEHEGCKVRRVGREHGAEDQCKKK